MTVVREGRPDLDVGQERDQGPATDRPRVEGVPHTRDRAEALAQWSGLRQRSSPFPLSQSRSPLDTSSGVTLHRHGRVIAVIGQGQADIPKSTHTVWRITLNWFFNRGPHRRRT